MPTAPSPAPAPAPVDYSKISINALNCDPCLTKTENNCNNECVYIHDNSSIGGKCVNKCTARITKGECEQYHIWNNSTLSPVIYDFDGKEKTCEWHPHPHSIDETPYSKEGDCRPRSKYKNDQGTFINSYCFQDCSTSTCATGTCQTFKDGQRYCVPSSSSALNNIAYCGLNYSGHHKQCNTKSIAECTPGSGCGPYIDERIHHLPSNTLPQDKGICVSDGKVTHDLTTGMSRGLLMTDEDCGAIKDSKGCMGYLGNGCLWEPFNQYCVPTVDTSSYNTLFNSCKPVEGHVPGDYDINMIEEEHINIADYRDRNNKKYPYITSKYLCDVCHVRNQDLDNMKQMSLDTGKHNELQYYMLKKYVDFGGVTQGDRSTSISMTPQQYCEREVDDTHNKFNPCKWETSGTNSGRPTGGNCVSKCSTHSPVDNTVTNSQELKVHRDMCISDKWFPEGSAKGIEFPKLIRSVESTDDYYEDRYCTWDGFECHNSIPCKFAQQTRCEDLGYEWYEGTALDIMNQPGNDSSNLGIPLDLSSSYPIVRKGDGKPVEGDMEGICIYPNVEAGFVSAPASYIINPKFIGHQVIMIKWREYGTGWWEDLSLCRKKSNTILTDAIITKHVSGDESKKSYFLGENVALIPFTINQGDKPDDIKTSINNALESYQYFIYNGAWVVWAEDIILSIDRSYDSGIGPIGGTLLYDRYRKYYGYYYYSNYSDLTKDPPIQYDTPRRGGSISEAKRLNTIYDLRGSINILPVINGKCALELTTLDIDSNSGKLSLNVHSHGDFRKDRFQFVEFIGTEIFNSSGPGTTSAELNAKLNAKLQLTVLSKYKYQSSNTQPDLLPASIVDGYGTLYENKNNINISKPPSLITDIKNNLRTINDSFDIRKVDKPPGNTHNDGLNKAKELIDLFKPHQGTGTPPQNKPRYGYSESELNSWAFYREYNNFNVFGQPKIKLKGEIYKAECDTSVTTGSGTTGSGTTGLKKLCSGSLESWKIFNENSIRPAGSPSATQSENPKPKYQILDLKIVNGLLKLMAKYYDTSGGNTFNNTYYSVASLAIFKNNYQPTELKESILWSITRNTPPFWGNLFYNRGSLVVSGNTNTYHILYNKNANYNLITGDTNPLTQKFKYYLGVNGNTMFKPFCQVGNVNNLDSSSGQNILWHKILKYTGGNKREIQLSRNVRNVDYNAYVNSLDTSLLTPTIKNSRKYYNSSGGGGTSKPAGETDHIIGLSYAGLQQQIKNLLPLVSLSKREYIIRSLLDLQRLDYALYSVWPKPNLFDVGCTGGSKQFTQFNSNPLVGTCSTQQTSSPRYSPPGGSPPGGSTCTFDVAQPDHSDPSSCPVGCWYEEPSKDKSLYFEGVYKTGKQATLASPSSVRPDHNNAGNFAAVNYVNSQNGYGVCYYTGMGKPTNHERHDQLGRSENSYGECLHTGMQPIQYWNVTRNDYPTNSSFNPSKPDANNWYYPGFCNYGNIYTISLTEPVAYINSTLTWRQNIQSLPRTINAGEPVSQKYREGVKQGQSTGFSGYVVNPVTSTSKNIVIKSTSYIGFDPVEALDISSGSNLLKIKPMGKGNTRNALTRPSTADSNRVETGYQGEFKFKYDTLLLDGGSKPWGPRRNESPFTEQSINGITQFINKSLSPITNANKSSISTSGSGGRYWPGNFTEWKKSKFATNPNPSNTGGTRISKDSVAEDSFNWLPWISSSFRFDGAAESGRTGSGAPYNYLGGRISGIDRAGRDVTQDPDHIFKIPTTSADTITRNAAANITPGYIDPTNSNSIIASLYHLSHIPIPQPLKAGNDNTARSLKTWGKTNNNVIQTHSDDTIWNNIKTNENTTIFSQALIDKLKYSDPSQDTSITGDNDSDMLKRWCLSNSSSNAAVGNSFLDDDLNIDSMLGKKHLYIDPDNYENNMGILSHNWMNKTYNYAIDTESEFFDRDKEINAYKYPQVCEPWLLRTNGTKTVYDPKLIHWIGQSPPTGSNINFQDSSAIDLDLLGTEFTNSGSSISGGQHSATFTIPGLSSNVKANDKVTQDNSNATGYVLSDTPTRSTSLTIKVTSGEFTDTAQLNIGNSNPPAVTVTPTGITSKKILFTNNTDWDTFTDKKRSGNTVATGDQTKNGYFKKLLNNIDTGELIGTPTNPKRKFYNMLHPLSITAARPISKVIYIDITPNNNILTNSNTSKINKFFFDENLPLASRATSLVTSIASNSSLNIYKKDGAAANTTSTNPEFWLHPGIDGLIGKNNNTPGNLSLSTKSNLYVSYFKKISDLISNSDANKIVIKKTGDTYDFKLDTSNTTFSPSFIIADTVFYSNLRGLGSTSSNFYYNDRLPVKQSSTTSVTNNIFGNGFISNSTNRLPAITGINYSDVDLSSITTTTGTVPTNRKNGNNTNVYKLRVVTCPQGNCNILPSVPGYDNINMVFPSGSTSEETSAINICKDLIKSKLSICGNPNNWSAQSKQGCITCFDVNNATSRGLCARYSDYVSGLPSATTDPAREGVCGILDNNRSQDKAWDFIDVTHQPTDFGSHMPSQSPYDLSHRTCDKLGSDFGIDFIPIQHAGFDGSTSQIENVAFFKPARSSSSDVFEDGHSSLSETPYGCMRKDLSLMKEENINLSCNTTLSTPIERDKHVIINFIIEHDPTHSLNSSQRTKLAIMSEEELINKALSLNINISDINEFTKPKLQTKVRDSLIPNLCEDGITHCSGGTAGDSECPGHYKCGLYEQWNDLQRYYYNINNEGVNKGMKDDFTTRKEWDYIGCGIDLNYSDSTSGEAICKDKYPGLCEQNIDKCKSKNKAVREAIMLDCPETCQVQFKDLDKYKGKQIGELSICTSRGRCKWSHDQDASNLLPPCEEHTTRELGSTEKCRNYNSLTDGPEAGSCNLKTHPQTINSSICAEQRCTSMQGCKFKPLKARYCKIESSVDPRILRETDCPQGGRWIGSSSGGQCILPERDLYDADLQNFEQDCNVLGGTIVQGNAQSCEYHPDLPYTGEDPCSHIVDLDDLTEDEKLKYFHPSISTIKVNSVKPEKLDGNSVTHPHYIEITLNTRLSDTNITTFNQLGLPSSTGKQFPKNKYIYIDNNSSNIGTLCIQYLVGKSRLISIENYGPGGTDNTKIIIGGPNKAYILPRDITTGEIDIGGQDACEFRGIYDLDNYYEDTTSSPSSPPGSPAPPPLSAKLKKALAKSKKALACYNNTNGACNYESKTTHCSSCSLYKDETSCFGNNDPNEFSHCGWGNIKDMCEVIGEIDECKKMHLDGCEWDPAKEKCSLNKLTDDDGNPLADKVGCVKCDDMKHKNTCNSMKNCFWDSLTKTPKGDNTGHCRACSSIGEPDIDTINALGAPWNNLKNKDRLISACDDIQLTYGQCEFRNPVTKVTGFESISVDAVSDIKQYLTSIKQAIMGEEVNNTPDMKKNECENDNSKCKCSPTRLYPLFPDWIFHNLFFLIVIFPFTLYFIIAWIHIFISPKKFLKPGEEAGSFSDGMGKIGKSIGEGYSDISEDIYMRKVEGINVKRAVSDSMVVKGISATAKGISATAEGISDTVNATARGISNAASATSNAVATRSKKIKKALKNNMDKNRDIGAKRRAKAKAKIAETTTGGGNVIDVFLNKITGLKNSQKMSKMMGGGRMKDLSMLGNVVMYDSNDNAISTDWISPTDDDLSLKSFLNPKLVDFKAQFHNLFPRTDNTGGFISDTWNSGGTIAKIVSLFTLGLKPTIFFKTLWLLFSLPLTLLQFVSNNLRLALPIRLSRLFFKFGGSSIVNGFKILTIPIGTFFAFIAYIMGVCVLLFLPPFLLWTGIQVVIKLTEYGIKPNPNYVDPIDGTAHNQGGVNYPAAAMWPKEVYRDEWDEMIKDPIADSVIQQRESKLPDIIQGDINDEDNVSDAYQMAYLEIEPKDLDWTKKLRNAGKTFNNFINRIGDNFILHWIIIPLIIYKYIKRITNYLPVEGNQLNIKSIIIWTITYGSVLGLLTAIFTPDKVKEGEEYDGVEKKCYGDIPLPFKIGNEVYNYPKLCAGDSTKEDKNECPYGCYYVGSGPGDTNYGLKCKNNRSMLSFGGIGSRFLSSNGLDPEPTLNIPFDTSKAIPSDWKQVTPETGKTYACPPTSSFLSKQPYDSLCSTTAKRCKSSLGTNKLDDYCEILYKKNNYNDTKCGNSFTGATDRYPDSLSSKAAKGELDIPGNLSCKTETPYEGYKSEYYCPFPLPAAENDFFSEKGDTRDSISLWNWAYDKIQNPDKNETCTKTYKKLPCLNDPAKPCTPTQLDDFQKLMDNVDYCNSIKLNKGSGEENRKLCEEGDNKKYGCEYFPERVPLQSSFQNQERYLIVNQNYGENLFS